MALQQDSPRVYTRPVIWGCVVAILILCLSCLLKMAGSTAIDLPAQWLWVSLVPVLLGLILGGFIKRLELPGGLKVETLNLPYYPPTSAVAHVGTSATRIITADAQLKTAYNGTMGNARNLFLVHVLQPSKVEGQRYDVSVYLMRHNRGSTPNQVTGFDDVDRAEFYFGENWPGMFTVDNEQGYIGVNTSAWGQFLAVCRVRFRANENGEEQTAILYRYIDFETAPRS